MAPETTLDGLRGVAHNSGHCGDRLCGSRGRMRMSVYREAGLLRGMLKEQTRHQLGRRGFSCLPYYYTKQDGE